MYCMLGLFIGSISDVARIVVLGSAVSLLTGAVMIALGCVQIVGGAVHLPVMITSRVRKLTSQLQGLLSMQSPSARSVINGMINGLLPCGISLSAIIAAATLPSTGDRLLFLLSFGIVTSPALAGLALLFNRISGGWKQRLRIASAVGMVLIGVLVTMRGMSLDVPFVSPKNAEHTHVHHGCCKTGNN